jgi:hypothetical protein
VLGNENKKYFVGSKQGGRKKEKENKQKQKKKKKTQQLT